MLSLGEDEVFKFDFLICNEKPVSKHFTALKTIRKRGGMRPEETWKLFEDR